MLPASRHIYYSYYPYFTRKPGGNASRDTYWLISCCTLKICLKFLGCWELVGLKAGIRPDVGSSSG